LVAMTEDSKTEIDSPPSVINLLSVLDAYFTCHTNGDQSIKSSVFNITKARRLQGGCIDSDEMSAYYSACQVREELLRARAIVICNSSVVEEDDKFTLSLDGELKNSKNHSSVLVEDDEGVAIDRVLELEHQGGLRQRKKKSSSSEPQKDSEWTEVQEIQQNEFLEEEKLKNMDPISLFGGFAPPALKEAQKNAKEALSAYVEAANLAAYILSALNSVKNHDSLHLT
jgi:hypothetical protein